jgi:Outer membrane protein beta-barrel domain
MNKISPLFLSFIFCINFYTIAQTDSIPLKKITFGVTVGYIRGVYKINRTNWETNGLGDTLSRFSSKSRGFSVALQYNYLINPKLTFRTQAGFVFDDLELDFFRKDGKIEGNYASSIFLSLPIDFVYTFTENKVNPSILLGMRYMNDIESTIKFRRTRYISLFPNSLGFEIGGELTVKRKNFILKPEINFYFSPLNSLEFENLFTPFKVFNSVYRNFIDFRLSVLR